MLRHWRGLVFLTLGGAEDLRGTRRAPFGPGAGCNTVGGVPFWVGLIYYTCLPINLKKVGVIGPGGRPVHPQPCLPGSFPKVDL